MSDAQDPPDGQEGQEGQKPAVPRANGITEQDFNQWATHPVTRAYRKFLTDFGEALKRDHAGRWLEGPLDADFEAEARGRALTHAELADLRFEHMLGFYATGSANAEEDSDEGQTGQ